MDFRPAGLASASKDAALSDESVLSADAGHKSWPKDVSQGYA